MHTTITNSTVVIELGSSFLLPALADTVQQGMQPAARWTAEVK